VLGAAVIDDVLGSWCSPSSPRLPPRDKGKALSGIEIGLTVTKASRSWPLPSRWAGCSRLACSASPPGCAPAACWSRRLSFCFVLAWLSDQVGSPDRGAFAAGLVLEEVHSREFTGRGERALDQLIEPISHFLVPSSSC